MSSIIKYNKLQSHLIVVSTPIGNLSEINNRAIQAFEQNEYFICEDTRTTKQLFTLLNLSYETKKFISYHKYNEKQKLDEVLEILKENNVVLVSDAGYPGFSDPGYIVINACIKNNIFVEVINGANAYIHALITSGWSNYPSTFYGFLDWKKYETISYHFPNTILCFYESVHRINETLKIMYTVFHDKSVCVVKELTKLNEVHYYSNLKDLQIPLDELKGEFVILINNIESNNEVNYKDLKNKFLDFDNSYIKANLKNKIKLYLELLNDKSISSNELYNLIIKNKND